MTQTSSNGGGANTRMMRAVFYRNLGGPDVLQCGLLPVPAPDEGEVLIRVHASGVNPADANQRAGRFGYGVEGRLIVPHSDGAGVVEGVGPGVSPAMVRKRVWFHNARAGRLFGSAAEYITLPVRLTAPLPEDVSFEEGACLGIPCMTAYLATFVNFPQPGQWVLITSGAGAVGHYAVQLAKWRELRVIAVVPSPADTGVAISAGADAVLDCSSGNVVQRILEITGGDGVSHAADGDFDGNLSITIPVLKVNGSLAYYASRGAGHPPFPVYEALRKNITAFAILLSTRSEAYHREAQEEITDWLSEAPRVHRVAAIFPLEQTVQAHKLVDSGAQDGTVVVRCM